MRSVRTWWPRWWPTGPEFRWARCCGTRQTTIVHLEDHLKDRIKGQDLALAAIAEGIRSSKAGIKAPGTPMGVFLLVGPSGVGKTESGLALAELLFGGERNVVTINMSEFQESYSVSSLIGAAPGLVGYGEGGRLTEAVRQQPYSVVLLDESEKAHIDVMNLFYQVFDKGSLTDGEGKEVNFKNTVMMLTSNLGTDVIQEMTLEDEMPPYDAVISAVRPILSQHFKPALLARMNVVPYCSLKADALKMIVELKLSKIKKTLMQNNRMTMTYSPAVVDQITERCTEVETGARNIDYILNGNVLPELARTILSHMAEGAMPNKVHLDVNEDGSFKLDFSNSENRRRKRKNPGRNPRKQPRNNPFQTDTTGAPAWGPPDWFILIVFFNHQGPGRLFFRQFIQINPFDVPQIQLVNGPDILAFPGQPGAHGHMIPIRGQVETAGLFFFQAYEVGNLAECVFLAQKGYQGVDGFQAHQKAADFLVSSLFIFQVINFKPAFQGRVVITVDKRGGAHEPDILGMLPLFRAHYQFPEQFVLITAIENPAALIEHRPGEYCGPARPWLLFYL